MAFTRQKSQVQILYGPPIKTNNYKDHGEIYILVISALQLICNQPANSFEISSCPCGYHFLSLVEILKALAGRTHGGRSGRNGSGPSGPYPQLENRSSGGRVAPERLSPHRADRETLRRASRVQGCRIRGAFPPGRVRNVRR